MKALYRNTTWRHANGGDVLGPILLLMIAAAWVAVLVPATRAGRDASHDGRTMQGFNTAMRVLSRRPATAPAYGRYIMVPTKDITEATAPVAPSPATGVVARRRRLLVRLLWTAGLTLVAAVFLRGPWPAIHAVVDVVLAAYVVRLRQLATRRAEVARAARRAALTRHEEELRAEYEARYHAAGEPHVVPRPAAPARPAYDPPARRAVNG